MSVNAPAPTPEPHAPATPSERRAVSLFRRDIVTRALIDSFRKLAPHEL